MIAAPEIADYLSLAAIIATCVWMVASVKSTAEVTTKNLGRQIGELKDAIKDLRDTLSDHQRDHLALRDKVTRLEARFEIDD